MAERFRSWLFWYFDRIAWPAGAPKSVLARFRSDMRLSKAELSSRLPVAYRTLQDWEAGVARPPRYLYRALRDLERELAE